MVIRYKLKLVMLMMGMKQKKHHLQVEKKEVLQVQVDQKKELLLQSRIQLHKVLIIHKGDNNQGELEVVIINKQTIKLYLN